MYLRLWTILHRWYDYPFPASEAAVSYAPALSVHISLLLLLSLVSLPFHPFAVSPYITGMPDGLLTCPE